MKNIFEKLINKVLPFVLCISIVSGASAPAYAAPTTIDQWAQYDGSGWSYNSSQGTFSWNTNMANSSEFVVLSYLRDIYSSIKTYNDNLKSGWLITSSSYSYPSGWSGSFYKAIIDAVRFVDGNIVNNFSSNLQSYTPYPLYSYKNFIDSNLYSSQSFGPGGYINNFFSAMSALNTNMSYIANQFYADNTSGSYNARSLLNQALHKYVDSSISDYSTVLNNIKSNTDYLSGIKTDTANLSGIKTDTANLSGIKTDTANLSGIKTDTASISSNSANILSRIDTFTQVPFRYLYKNGGFGEPLLWSEVPASNIPYYTYNDGSPRILFQSATNIGLQGYLDVLNKNLVQVGNLIHENYAFFNVYQKNSQGGYVAVSRYNFSLMDILQNINAEFGSMLSAINFVIADPDTIAAKIANKNNESAVLTNFTGSGSASASPSDFGAVKDSIVDFKAGFSGGASSSDTFSFMSGDSNAWDWFTQETANALDRTQGSNTRLLLGSSDVAYDTPLLDSYYSSILSILGGEN